MITNLVKTKWECEKAAITTHKYIITQRIGGVMLLMFCGLCLVLSVHVDGGFLMGALLSLFFGICALFARPEGTD